MTVVCLEPRNGIRHDCTILQTKGNWDRTGKRSGLDSWLVARRRGDGSEVIQANDLAGDVA